MPNSPLDYDQIMEDALRSVVKKSLEYVVENGLPPPHHFYITFRTNDPGVSIPDSLHARHPHEMTIVLQHKFWDLVVEDERFSVTLSFNKMPSDVVVPFAAVTAFADPSAKFGLRFTAPGEEESAADGIAPFTPVPQNASPDSSSDSATGQAEDGENVVALDRFRKK